MRTYEVNYKANGVTSAIDTIKAPEGYTAENYLVDCKANADDEWNEMLSNGEISLVDVTEA